MAAGGHRSRENDSLLSAARLGSRPAENSKEQIEGVARGKGHEHTCRGGRGRDQGRDTVRAINNHHHHCSAEKRGNMTRKRKKGRAFEAGKEI